MTFKPVAPLLCCLLMCAAGCSLIPPLPATNLAEPGWQDVTLAESTGDVTL